MKTLKEIEKRIDEIFEEHKDKVELACCEYHGHTVRRKCFIAKDPNELIICELCEWAGILLDRFNVIREKTE